jgi:hypothetical protein
MKKWVVNPLKEEDIDINKYYFVPTLFLYITTITAAIFFCQILIIILVKALK